TPYGQSSSASASDPFGQASPYGQPSSSSASDPYAAEQHGWTPAADPAGSQGADGAQAGYGAQPGYSAQSADGGQAGYGAQPGYGEQPGYAAGAPAGAGAPQGEAQSRLLVGLMGIFFGSLGVHRFLMGYTTIGIIQIVVTIVTCGFGSLWGFVEGIMVLARAEAFERDAYGRPLKD